MVTVAQYIVKYLEDYGIKHCFSVVGGGAMFLNNAFGNSEKIKPVYMHHEQACAIAAEGYSRITNQLSVVCITTGPGGLNTLTGVMGQWTDSMPVLYISGQVDTKTIKTPDMRQLGDQEINIIDIVSPITKYAEIVSNPYDIKYQLDQAIHYATYKRNGPVWLDIPLNIQNTVIDETKLEGYDRNKNVIGCHNSIISEAILKEIQKSKKPLIIAGHGIRLADAREEFYKILNLINIPVATTFNGFDLLPDTHGNYIGRVGSLGSRGANKILQECDLLICLGTRNNVRQIGYNSTNFAPQAKKIIVDIDKTELDKKHMRGDISIYSDLKYFLLTLLYIIGNLNNGEWDHIQWLSYCKTLFHKYPLVDTIHKDTKIDGLNPYVFTNELSECLPEDAVVVCGNGTACVSMFQSGIVKNMNQRFFWNSGTASMGYDIPAAIGAHFASGKEIILLTGDGSIMMNLQELQTIAHYHLPIKIFILNNGGYHSIIQTQTKFCNGQIKGCDQDSGVSFPSFYEIANTFGLSFYDIDNNMSLPLQLQQVKTIVQSPAIIDVKISRDYIFAPRLSSEKKSDGTIVQGSFENMYPYEVE